MRGEELLGIPMPSRGGTRILRRLVSLPGEPVEKIERCCRRGIVPAIKEARRRRAASAG